jgi:hypothetical protein
MNTQADAQFILEWVDPWDVVALIPMGKYATAAEATAATAACWKELLKQCSSYEEKVTIATGDLCLVRECAYGKPELISKSQIPDDQWFELCSLDDHGYMA